METSSLGRMLHKRYLSAFGGKHIGLSIKIEDICPCGKSPSVSRLLKLKILLVLKWHSFNTQAIFGVIFSALLSLELAMAPLFEPSTIFLVSASTSIIAHFYQMQMFIKVKFPFLDLYPFISMMYSR